MTSSNWKPQRWEAPSVDPEPTPEPLRLTAERIEALEADVRSAAEAAGFAEGLARGEAEVQARLSALDQLLSHLAEPLRRVDAAVEETLLALTLSFTEAIIGERPPPSEAALAALLREALEALPDPDREAVVYLNPLDLQRLGAVLEVEMPGRPWRLEADEGLELGDLRVQAGLTEVDARRRTRMVQLFETLMPGDEASEGRAER